MPAGFSGHSATRVDVWVPIRRRHARRAGLESGRVPERGDIIARVAPGERRRGGRAGERGTRAPRRRSSASAGRRGAAERRIAFALAGVSVLVLVIGLANAATLLLVRGTRGRRESAIRAALGATRGRLFARILLEAAILASMATAGALALSSWLGEAVRRLVLTGVIENEGLTTARSWRRSAPVSERSRSRRVVGLCSCPVTCGRRSLGREPRRAPQPRLHHAAAGADDAVGRADCRRGPLRTQPVQPDGAGLRHAPGPGIARRPRAGTGSVADQDEIFGSALERVASMPGVGRRPRSSRAVLGISRAADRRPGYGRAAERRRAAAVSHRRDAGVFRDSRHRDRPGPAVHRSRRSRRTGRHRQRDHGAHGVARRERPRQVHPDRVRSVVRSLHGGRSARATDHRALPRGRRRGARRPSAIGRAERHRRSADAVLRPVLAGAAAARRCRPGPGFRDCCSATRRCRQPHRAHPARGRGRSHRPAVCRGASATRSCSSGRCARGASAPRCWLFSACSRSVSPGSDSMPSSRTRSRSGGARWLSGSRSAPVGQVMAMILGEAGRVATVGVLCGCALAVVAGRWLQSMLVGTSPSDPFVLGSAGVLMLIVAAVATFLPARSASRANPTALLRAEWEPFALSSGHDEREISPMSRLRRPSQLHDETTEATEITGSTRSNGANEDARRLSRCRLLARRPWPALRSTRGIRDRKHSKVWRRTCDPDSPSRPAALRAAQAVSRLAVPRSLRCLPVRLRSSVLEPVAFVFSLRLLPSSPPFVSSWRRFIRTVWALNSFGYRCVSGM